jgi:hypothetical protein
MHYKFMSLFVFGKHDVTFAKVQKGTYDWSLVKIRFVFLWVNYVKVTKKCEWDNRANSEVCVIGLGLKL